MSFRTPSGVKDGGIESSLASSRSSSVASVGVSMRRMSIESNDTLVATGNIRKQGVQSKSEEKDDEPHSWEGAILTLRAREQQQEREQEALQNRIATQRKMNEEYLSTRRFPVKAGLRSEDAVRRSGAMAYKQDRGPNVSERTRANARAVLARSYSSDPRAVPSISQSATARPMMSTTESGLEHQHPWTLLASARAPNKEEKVPALKALRKRGREVLVGCVQGGYEEVIARLLPGLEDQESEARAATADILGDVAETGDAVVVDALIFGSEDPDDYVRVAALEALRRVAAREELRDRCQSPALRAALRACSDGDPDVREAAVLAVGALGAFGSKTAIDAIFVALEDVAEAVSEAAVEALILIGDVFDLDPGNEALFELRNLAVAPRRADDAPRKASNPRMYVDWAAAENVRLALWLEPPVRFSTESVAVVRALRQWVERFGVRGLADALGQMTYEGRPKVLAMVEDCMVPVEGDVQLAEAGRPLVMAWQGFRLHYRPIGATAEDPGWAWEYRKQALFSHGYDYVDLATGEVAFSARMRFDEVFAMEGGEEEGAARRVVLCSSGEVVAEYVEQALLHTAPRSAATCAAAAAAGEGEGRPETSWYGDANRPSTSGFGVQTARLSTSARPAGGVHWSGQYFDLHADDAEELKARVVVRLECAEAGSSAGRPPWKVVGQASVPLRTLAQKCANVSEALSTEEDGTWAGVGVPLRLEVIDQDLPHRPTHPAILAAARASAGEYGAGDTMEEAAASEAEGEGGQREEGDANGGGKGEVEGWLWLEGRFSTAEDRIVAGILARLEHPDLAVRRASLRAISAFVGAGNARAVRGVLRRLEHPEAAVRASAVEAVTLVAPLGDLSAVDGCLALCHDARADVRASALEALARVAPLSLPAFLPTCASLIDDPAPQVRHVAQEILETAARGHLSRAAPPTNAVLGLTLQWGAAGILEKEDIATAAATILRENLCYGQFVTGPLSSRPSGLTKTSLIE